MSRQGRKFKHGANLIRWKGKARIQCLCGKQSPIFKDTEEVMDGQIIVVPKEELAHEWFIDHVGLIEVRKETTPDEEH